MADEHRISGIGIERAEGLVGDRGFQQQVAALEGEGAAGVDLEELAVGDRVSRPPGTGGRKGAGVRAASTTGVLAQGRGLEVGVVHVSHSTDTLAALALR